MLAPDEPYSYAAWQHFKLFPDRLVVETEVENRGARRMPFGFGQHPWFMPDRDVDAALRCRHGLALRGRHPADRAVAAAARARLSRRRGACRGLARLLLQRLAGHARRSAGRAASSVSASTPSRCSST